MLCMGLTAVTQLIIVLRGLLYLRFTFPRKLRPNFQSIYKSFGAPAPSVTVFIPCKGISADLQNNIASMLCQDYTNYRLFYITESKDDPASALLASTASQNHRLHHVIAGCATRCCQKNHNLLTAIDYAKKKGIAGEIYVFADMDVCPDKNWLNNITLPLADETVFAVTGFGSLIPGGTFSEHFHAAFNALQEMAMTGRCYAAMWGGAMALTRQHFETYDVHRTWSTAVVDDMALTAIIKKHRLKRVFSPDCRVMAEAPYPNLNRVLKWIIRQTQYAAIYLPSYTLLGICLNTALLLGIFMLPVTVLLALLGDISWDLPLCHLIFYILTSLSISLLSAFGEHKKLEWRWLVYAPLFLILGTYCTWIGFFSKRIVWANIVYNVGKNGEVFDIRREKTA